MAHSKAKFKSNGNTTSPCFKPFLQETCRHIFVCLDSVIGFIQTLLLALPFHGDIKLNENIIQDLSPNWIIGFFEFYILPHFIPFFFLKYLTNPKYMISNSPISSKPTLTAPNNFLLHKQRVKYTFICCLCKKKLLGIASVGFDEMGQVLIIYFGFVGYFRKKRGGIQWGST